MTLVEFEDQPASLYSVSDKIVLARRFSRTLSQSFELNERERKTPIHMQPKSRSLPMMNLDDERVRELFETFKAGQRLGSKIDSSVMRYAMSQVRRQRKDK